MTATAFRTVLHTLRRSALRHDQMSLPDSELLENFVSQRDDAAFEVLLRRHGPMVFGVCRRVLQNDADTEDAFQATFLVLVRKAASVRPRSMVGNWLYGVAHSTALKARAMRNKRLAKEKEAAARAHPNGTSSNSEHLEVLLDQELRALPDKYRVAIVMCDLEGKTLKETAQQLGCPLATIGTRLARGRAMLAKRLGRKGMTVSGLALTAMLSEHVASAAVPTGLAVATMQSASALASGNAATGCVVSAQVTSLVNAVLKTMLLAKLKMTTAMLIVITCLIGAGGCIWHTQSGELGASPGIGDLAASPHTLQDTPRDESVGLSNARPREDFRHDGPKTIAGPPVADLRIEPNVVVSPEVKKTVAAAETQRNAISKQAKKLPPGLAKKRPDHPGRVAWLAMH